MKSLSSILILASILLVLVLNLACTDAATLVQEESMLDSSASDEISASLRSKKEAGGLAAQQVIPSPLRRHHLKFGVLGKRYAYGYLGKRAHVPQTDSNLEEWLDSMRERRGGRPQYGMLG